MTATSETDVPAPDGSESPVEPAESTGKHDRHDEDARTEDEHVLVLAQIEAPDAAHE
jgi:hypothetical protein